MSRRKYPIKTQTLSCLGIFSPSRRLSLGCRESLQHRPPFPVSIWDVPPRVYGADLLEHLFSQLFLPPLGLHIAEVHAAAQGLDRLNAAQLSVLKGAPASGSGCRDCFGIGFGTFGDGICGLQSRAIQPVPILLKVAALATGPARRATFGDGLSYAVINHFQFIANRLQGDGAEPSRGKVTLIPAVTFHTYNIVPSRQRLPVSLHACTTLSAPVPPTFTATTRRNFAQFAKSPRVT